MPVKTDKSKSVIRVCTDFVQQVGKKTVEKQHDEP